MSSVHEGPRRTTFSFAAPADNAAAWPLRLDTFAARLSEGFRDAGTRAVSALGPRASEALVFEVQLADGQWLSGLATTPFPDMGAVMVELASAAEAAEFAVWLRDRYAPAPELVEFTTEFAMESGVEGAWPIPPDSTREDLARLFEEHIAGYDG